MFTTADGKWLLILLQMLQKQVKNQWRTLHHDEQPTSLQAVCCP